MRKITFFQLIFCSHSYYLRIHSSSSFHTRQFFLYLQLCLILLLSHIILALSPSPVPHAYEMEVTSTNCFQHPQILYKKVHNFILVLYIVTHMPIARQQLCKHILEVTFSTVEGNRLLGNGPINTHSWQKKAVFSVGSVPRNYKRGH
jgi:hypothetical protein